MKKNEVKKITPALIALSDVLTLPISLLPVILAWSIPVLLIRQTWSSPWIYAALASTPFIAALSLIVSIWLIRMLLPKLKKGLYPLGFNRGFLAWYLHLALSRSGDISGLKLLIQSSILFKYFFWRAHGARIAFGINSSMTLNIVDYPMIEVGPGATLADGVGINAHMFIGDRLLIAPVRLGKNVFVGYKSLVGARSKIDDDVWIGIHNVIAGDIISSGTKIENFSWEHGNPNRKFANNLEH